MVTSTRTASRLMIVARPNQSATWRANLLVLLALSVPSLGIAVAFAMLGAWPILPFAGLEILSLGGALYYVNWKLQYRHVITLSKNSVRVDKGFYAPRHSWRFQRRHAGLSITAPENANAGPEVCVHDRRNRVVLGEFLSRDESLALIELLRGEICVRADGPGSSARF